MGERAGMAGLCLMTDTLSTGARTAAFYLLPKRESRESYHITAKAIPSPAVIGWLYGDSRMMTNWRPDLDPQEIKKQQRFETMSFHNKPVL
jgi:hypothetical protein